MFLKIITICAFSDAKTRPHRLLHHIIVRGLENRPIFFDDQDCEEFLSRFSLLLEEASTDCFAWDNWGQDCNLANLG